MPRIIALCLACGPAAAADVALIGVIGDKAAVLAVDGGDPKTVKVGQKWNGIAVLSVQKDRATVEIDGKRRVLMHGQHYRGTPPTSDRQQVTLSSDAAGMFVTEGAINGLPVRFVVDTGASSIALPGREAQRLGLDYRNGERALVNTANGVTAAYRVTLDRVKLGAIELNAVDGVVIEQGLSITLLGMSFLNRVEMKRDGERMTLIRRF
ncbi:MAG TPA: TIGR02281 family clan AA aspartic protease [Burkholderiales bacterium]|nr:TIGR02281 family clan AA aspartic protease [Burkholderiales bacterium]